MDADSPTSCPGCDARERQIADLQRQIAQQQRQIAQQQRQITQLQANVVKLDAALEQARRGGKRQAAPFAKQPPKRDPKRPGRKKGEDYGPKAHREAPKQVDETFDAPLPDACPHCGGGQFVETHVTQQYQVEIPRKPIYRQFNVAVGQCTCCGQRVQGRHALQTSDALGCCASQIGPNAQALVVILNKQMGLSYGKIARLMKSPFGVPISRSGACQTLLRAGRRCEPTYRDILAAVGSSETAVPDETGWRIAGRSAWLHTVVTPHATAYLVHRKRGFEAMSLLLGADYAGRMTHDGWAPYDRFVDATHQTCLAHLLRRCRELLELATGGAVRFPRQVKAILQEALATRDQRDAGGLSTTAATQRADEFERRMLKLVTPTKQHAGNERFAKHLWKRIDQLFTFLRWPGVDATNCRAEQAIRPAVVNRKVCGGNRTPTGAAAQSILMSVLVTAAQIGRDPLDWLSQTLRANPTRGPALLVPALD